MFIDALTTFFALSAVVILALFGLWAIVWAAARRSPAAARLREAIVDSLGPAAPWLAWGMALVAMAGSLTYSEVAHYAPCEFCWYQRIAMYPLALTLGIAAVRRDRGHWRYSLPVVAIGAALSTYHYLMQQFPDLSAGSCSAATPCTAAWVWEFGFVSIPLMALACFAAIAALVTIGRAHAAGTA